MPNHTPVRASLARSFPVRRLARFGIGAILSVALCPAALAALLTGTVNNSATGDLLQGARVEIPALSASVLADSTGRYLIPNVPAGSYEVVASYLGLDTVRATVEVGANNATLNFNLTSDIYKLESFKVTGEREGSAAAITAQRNAANLKNVVAMDQFGNLPNMSAGELAVRLPGVSGALDNEGNVTGLFVRGTDDRMNRVTVDGNLMANVGGLTRAFQTHSLTGAMFDQLEVIKGHTPDQSADSMGGTINLKTRSPLSMNGKRRITYSLTGRWAPTFAEHIPLRRDHPLHPLFNLAYEEVFDVAGGERNLGVAVNGFYSENVSGYFRTIRDYQDTTSSPAYLWDYRTLDGLNNRKQASGNVKFDFRLSPNHQFYLNTIYNDAFEPFNRTYEVRAFTGSATTVPSATSGVVPGYTDQVTTVRPVAAAIIDVTGTQHSFRNRTRQANLGGEHSLLDGALTVDWDGSFSRMRANVGVQKGGGGTMATRLTGAGWILDRTQDDLAPQFIANGGPDFTNWQNYRPTGALTARNTTRNVEISGFRTNALYKFPLTGLSLKAKTGYEWRRQKAFETSQSRRWNYAGTTALEPDTSIVTSDSQRTGRNIPQWDMHNFMDGYVPKTPSLWNEDRYFAEQQQYTGTRGVTETVNSAYGMFDAKYKDLGILSGVRFERTEDDSYGYVRARTLSSNAQRVADPVGAAASDYADNYRERNGSYTKAFPSAHVTYDITPNLKARLSWSTSFGRPAMGSLVPNETPNETTQTVTMNNVALRPQMAKNWDATLDYYFDKIGNFSVGWFKKDIRDYIVTGINGGTIASGDDNGFNGEYSGFTILTQANAGTAHIQGWEASYSQQLTFLPGLLSGLAVSANYTWLKAEGDFGGTVQLASNQVEGFTPRTGNLNVSWNYRGFGARVLVNYTGSAIDTYSATSAARNEFRAARTITNLGFSYQFNPKLTVFCDVANLTNEPQGYYRGTPDRMSQTIITGTTLNLGVTGRF